MEVFPLLSREIIELSDELKAKQPSISFLMNTVRSNWTPHQSCTVCVVYLFCMPVWLDLTCIHLSWNQWKTLCILFCRLVPGTLRVAWTWRTTRKGKRLMSPIPYPIDPWLSPPYWYSIYFFNEYICLYICFVKCSWRRSVAESWDRIVLHNMSSAWFLRFWPTYNEDTMCCVLCTW